MTAPKALGIVKSITGLATATDSSGVVRVLKAGDKIFLDDVIATLAGTTLEIALIDVHILKLPENGTFEMASIAEPTIENAVIEIDELSHIIHRELGIPLDDDLINDERHPVDFVAPSKLISEVTSGYPTEPIHLDTHYKIPYSWLFYPQNGVTISPETPSIQNDMPSITPFLEAVAETALYNQWARGNQTGPFPQVTEIDGNLSNNVDVGRDGPAVFCLEENLQPPALSSQGIPLSYTIQGNTLLAYVQLYQNEEEGPIERHVFALTLQSDGQFHFDLLSQLDHDSSQGYNDLLLELGGWIHVKDNNGDKVNFKPSDFSILVHDDIPQLQSEGLIFTVSESTLDNSSPNGSGSTGSQDPNIPAFVEGDLINLIKPGADQNTTCANAFSFINTIEQPIATDLISKGSSISFVINGNTLTAYSEDEREIFDLVLSPNGHFSFTLKDQLDHSADPNTPHNNLFIDFGSYIQYVDYDQDPLILTGTFQIEIIDDVPVLNEHKETNSVSEALLGTDLSTGSQTSSSSVMASGELSSLVKSGADENGHFQWNPDAIVAPKELFSKGDSVTYSLEGATLHAYAGEREVFNVTLSGNGHYEFILLDQLDHDSLGENSNSLDLNFGGFISYVDHDGDPLPLNENSLVITVNDDVPKAIEALEYQTVNENALDTQYSQGTAANNTPVTASGNLSHLIISGADESGRFEWASQNQNVPSGLKSQNEPIFYNFQGDTLAATANNHTVFTLQLATDGNYTFTLYDQIDHLAGEGTNKFNLNFSSFIHYLDADGNAVPLYIESFLITIVDDVPVLTSGRESQNIYEKNLNTDFSLGSQPFPVPGAYSISGDLSHLVTTGADEQGHFEWNPQNLNPFSGLTVQGAPVFYSLHADTLTASANGHPIFTLQLNQNGTYTFNLYDQLDHEPGNGNNSLILDFSLLIQYQDQDHDAISLGENSFQITVIDDLPIATEANENQTIDEKFIDTSYSQGTGADGISFTFNPVSVSGHLNSLVRSGADEFGHFELATLEQNAFSGLSSQNMPILYSILGDLLTATANNHTVFTLQLNPGGSYTFNLFDQIDHPAGNGTNTLDIDFSSVIRYVDQDGDAIPLAENSFTITVIDDVPMLELENTINSTVYEKFLDTAQSQGSAADNDPSTINPVSASGNLNPIIITGADETGHFEWANPNQSAPTDLKSQGISILYTFEGNILTATANDIKVFTLQLDPNGAYTFTLFDQIDHPAGHGANMLTLNFDSYIQYVDQDGDAIPLYETSLRINVIDDTPTPAPDQNEHQTVNEKYLDTNSSQGSAADTDPNTSHPESVSGNLSALVRSGADEPGHFEWAIENVTQVMSNLTSKGASLSYSYENDILTATAHNNVIFTLELASDGNYTFTLFDQLDHPAGLGNNLINLDFSPFIQYLDQDADPLPLNLNSFLITIIDDVPSLTQAHESQTIEEALLDTSFSQGSAADNDFTTTYPVSVTGSISDFIRSGADEPGRFELANQFEQSISSGLTSNNVPILYTIAGNSIIATANNHDVFTLQMFSDGNYTFTLFDQLDHAPAQGNNLLTLDFSSYFHYVDQDGDAIPLARNSFQITIIDDVPSVTRGHESQTVYERYIDTASSQGSGADQDPSTTHPVSVSSNLNALVRSGADEAGHFEWINPGQNVSSGLTSHDLPILYSFQGDTLTATGKGSTVVFTLKLEAHGAYTFTLFDQLDHPPGNGANELNLDFSSFLSYVDQDGDAIPLSLNSFQITVVDDIPVLTGTNEVKRVGEHFLDTQYSQGSQADNDPNTFNNLASVSGNLNTLVRSGADEYGYFEWANPGQNIDSGLSSQSSPIFYSFLDQTLIAAANNHTIFTLTLSSDGLYTFTLFDQIDHPPGNGTNSLDIDFSSLIRYIDSDHDSISLNDNSFMIRVIDDAPSLTRTSITQTIDEKFLDTTYSQGTAADTNPNTFSPVSVSGNINTLVRTGADEPGHFEWISQSQNTVSGLSSKNAPIFYNILNDTLTATANNHTIFTLKMNANGSYTFTLFDQLDHPTGNGANSLDIDFSSLIRYVDYDNDSIPLNPQSFMIKVVDDVPIAHSDVDYVFNTQNAITKGNILTGQDPDAGQATYGLQADQSGADEPMKLVSITYGNKVYSLATDDPDHDGIIVIPTNSGGELKIAMVDNPNAPAGLKTMGDYIYTVINTTTSSLFDYHDFVSNLREKQSWEDQHSYTFSLGTSDPNDDITITAKYLAGNGFAYLAYHTSNGSSGAAAGIGVEVDFGRAGGGVNGPKKVSQGEALEISFASPVNAILVTLADLPNQNKHEISWTIKGTDALGHDVILQGTLDSIGLGNQPGQYLFNQSDINIPINIPGPIAIESLELSTVNASASASFTLKAIETERPSFQSPEVFTYNIQDHDGDTSQATLTINPSTVPPIISEPVPPTVTLSGENLNVTATNLSTEHNPIGNQNVGHYLLVDSLKSEGKQINPSLVNGVDPANLKLSAQADVSVQFVNEGAGYHNMLGYYTYDANGKINSSSVNFLWLDLTTNNPSQNYSNLVTDFLNNNQPETINLGTLDAGTRLGFFLVADGANYDNNTKLLKSLAGVDKNSDNYSSDINSINHFTSFYVDNNGNGHITVNGKEIEGSIFFTHDKTLNTDYKTGDIEHSLSGVNKISATQNDGWLYIGFEDLNQGGDKDYNDAIFRVNIGDYNLAALNGATGHLQTAITDDHSSLISAHILTSNFLTGDQLILPATPAGLTVQTNFSGLNPDITITGTASISVYKSFIEGILFKTANNPSEGLRDVSVSVTDIDHLTSNIAHATFDVVKNDIVSSSLLSATGANDLGRGDDTVYLSDHLNGIQHINGNTGEDTIHVGVTDMKLDNDPSNADFLDFSKLKNFEKLDMTGYGKNTTTLSVEDVLNMTDNNHLLKIFGDGSNTTSTPDKVFLQNDATGTWHQDADPAPNVHQFSAATAQGAVTVQVQADLQAQVVAAS